MSKKTPKNIPASVRQQLLNMARTDKRPFNELLQYYAMERFLYRLSLSRHAKRFILKGALMLRVWNSPQFRPTMDIDLLGISSNKEQNILAQIRDILSVSVDPDGIVFDPSSINLERITEDADYEGIRVRFKGTLDTARVNMQIDIGFGDVVFPLAEEAELPTMLDSPAPQLLCYSRESAIAEKFEAMVKLREFNSRMKDFYDIWLLSRQFDFEGKDVAEAIWMTFENRGTSLPTETTIFSKAFAQEKQIQWAAYMKRLQQAGMPLNFADVISSIEKFLVPIVSCLKNGISCPSSWTAPGPWV